MTVSENKVVRAPRQKEQGLKGGRSEWHPEIIPNLHFSTNTCRVTAVLNQSVVAETS